MTVTKEELQYIADHWLPHQTLLPNSWGKSLTEANPETYLALYRGVVFTKFSTTEISSPSFTPSLTISPDSFESLSFFSKTTTTNISPSIFEDKVFLLQILRDWYTFLLYENYFDYKYDIKYTHSVLLHNIIFSLSKYIIEKQYERIYTLE